MIPLVTSDSTQPAAQRSWPRGDAHPHAARAGALTCGYLRLMEVRAPVGSLASSESRMACTVVALGWCVSVST